MSEQCQSDNFASAPEDSYSSEPSHNVVDDVFEKVMTQHSNPDFSFYKEYCRLFLSNIQLVKQVQSTLIQIKQTQELNRQLEAKLLAGHRPSGSHGQSHSNPEDSTDQKKKRMRRTAGEIARHYICQYEKCQKSYGSEGSLNQHMKLKHNIAND